VQQKAFKFYFLHSFRWQGLQGALGEHKQKLAAALEIHMFNRDVDDVNERINEKALLLSSEDVGKDLTGVQTLQRKQEEVSRDMTALQNQLEVRVTSALGILIHGI
jgi:spectrin beta